jgi:5-hydroxyisourate hydrolase
MSGLSTHVLDLARGRPAEGVEVRLERRIDGAWVEIAAASTDADGRVARLLPPDMPLVPGAFRLRFELRRYFAAQEIEPFFPEALLTFDVRDANRHHHVPLLVAAHGYSTYRGS